MDAPKKPPRTTKGDMTRHAIRRGAKRVFAIDGFHKAKIADIMAAADRSPGAFYIYFASKEELLSELLEEFRTQLRRSINRPVDPGESPLANIGSSVSMFWRIYRENWPIATAAFQLSMVDREFASRWRDFRRFGIKALAMVIRDAQGEGYCPGLDAEMAASALCSMIEYSCYNWTAKGGDFPERHVADEVAVQVLMTLILKAIGWRGEAAPEGGGTSARRRGSARRGSARDGGRGLPRAAPGKN
ncbi:MAG: TetR/AcrR family transcriptional regulator [Burkholderiales bacterium]|nr:TetR/AcrR family transcriptional regulator [Burkholderiales bacterium]